MPRLEPALLPVVSDLERGLRLLGVRFAVIGALVPELLLQDDERRYGLDHQGAGVPFEYTGAFLLGIDGRPFVSAEVTRAVAEVLRSIADADVDVAGVIAREHGRVAIDDDARAGVLEHFAWYSRGLAE